MHQKHPLSHLLPAAVRLVIVFTQMRACFGNRFHLWTNFIMIRDSMPGVFVLMVVGTLPDYAQGLVKLGWALRGKA